MANVNKVILVGRLTRDPEARTFGTGGKVSKFGFAVGSRRKNQQTGQWEDGDPMFIDCEAYNKGDFGHLADRIEQYLRKGSQVYLEGRLKLDQWDDKTTGAKRSKHVLVVDNMEFLEARRDGGEGSGGYDRPARSGSPSPQRPPSDQGYSGGGEPAADGGSGADSDIPF